MDIYDISIPISPSIPVWPGDKNVTLVRSEKIEDGNDANVSYLEMSVHTGTHVDAPYHFLGGEAPTVDQLDLTKLVGPATVVQFSDEVELITAEILQNTTIDFTNKRILFKTRNSKLWKQKDHSFQENFVALSADGAQFLVNQRIQLVGIDYLSIAPFKEGIPTHRILLQAGVIIIESLNLGDIDPGNYQLYCLPLNLVGSDGAPARTILVKP